MESINLVEILSRPQCLKIFKLLNDLTAEEFLAVIKVIVFVDGFSKSFAEVIDKILNDSKVKQ